MVMREELMKNDSSSAFRKLKGCLSGWGIVCGHCLSADSMWSWSLSVGYVIICSKLEASVFSTVNERLLDRKPAGDA